MMYAAIGLGVAILGVITYLVHAALSAKSDLITARDLLNGARKESAEWEHKFTVEEAAHAVTTADRAREKTLRAIAEAQRSEAQRRVGQLIRTHIPMATNAEIQEMTNEVFASPLSLAPRPPSLPKLPDPDDPRDALLDPFADVPTPKPT